jgi:meiotically up-regulated gene 157 (Mug157) protein
LIQKLGPLFKDPDMATLFSNTLPNTLDTTVLYQTGDSDSFIITGDIEALWLRDSMNQMLPYLPYMTEESDGGALMSLSRGLIKRQANCLSIDSFANAYNYNTSLPLGHQDDQRTPPMTWGVYEGKYEVDSPLAFLKLSYWHHKLSGDSKPFDDAWRAAVDSALETIEAMCHVGTDPAVQPYSFQRTTSVATDTLGLGGLGPAGRPVPGQARGLTRSLFRPSDDATTLPYNIPGNAMACVELGHAEQLLRALGDSNRGQHAGRLADSICQGLNHVAKQTQSGLSTTPDKDQSTAQGTGTGLPYEVDGFGGRLFMDDANIPSLLALPILGYASPDSDLYRRTRASLLSEEGNPFFFRGPAAPQGGIGGPHIGYGMVWPMSLAVRAMTAEQGWLVFLPSLFSSLSLS